MVIDEDLIEVHIFRFIFVLDYEVEVFNDEFLLDNDEFVGNVTVL